jgi:hypothetical protein
MRSSASWRGIDLQPAAVNTLAPPSMSFTRTLFVSGRVGSKWRRATSPWFFIALTQPWQ